MHHNADEEVKEYGTDIFPAIGVTYYFQCLTHCSILLTGYIVMNSNKHIRKRRCYLRTKKIISTTLNFRKNCRHRDHEMYKRIWLERRECRVKIKGCRRDPLSVKKEYKLCTRIQNAFQFKSNITLELSIFHMHTCM